MQKRKKFRVMLSSLTLALFSTGVFAQSAPANQVLPFKRIALLLPLQGKLADAGEAVSDGFFTAYYQTLSSNPSLNDLTITRFDTSKGASSAYQQAIASGAELIIGPLDKEDVNQIAKIPGKTVKTLSLNFPDTQLNIQNPNFYPFGLSADEDAKQLAKQAWEFGHRRALVVAPAQDWSERSSQAFIAEWQKLGGTLVAKTTFSTQDRFSESLKNLLLVDESQNRFNTLQQQLAVKMEFMPRRRDDIDMVFVAATPTQGRQIKPTFAFYFANNIPVYATGQIYAGTDDATGNDDLNGVIFTALPWQFDTSSPEKITLEQQPKLSAVYGRMHALGVDAFRVQMRLGSLSPQHPSEHFSGATGELTIDNKGKIERNQLLARFQNGIASPIATVAPSNETSGE